MPTIYDSLKYSETAFAAYTVDLDNGQTSRNQTLYNQSAGMTRLQAQSFNVSWQVLDQQDLSNGFSAVLFQQVDQQGNPVGDKVLAIRGTEPSHWGIDYLTDVINIAVLGTNVGMPQYNSLESFYQTLVSQGKLSVSEQVVVTGHSLGGFLAQAFAAKHDSSVSRVYTYNAPGFSASPGVIFNYATQLLEFFGITDATIPNDKITNIRATEGLSATAGLGQMIGSIQEVSIEPSFNPIHNHSIVTLTDALAVYNLFAGIDPSLDLETIGGILKASAAKAENTLESAVSAVGELLAPGFTLRTGNEYNADRDLLYQDVQSISRALEGSSGLSITAFGAPDQDGSFVPLSPSQIENLARSDIAYRYALVKGNPFAVLGLDYSAFNANGELDLYDPSTGRGRLTNMYLADRAEFLACLLQANLNDTTDVGGDGPPLLFTDVITGGENISISSGTRSSLLGQPRCRFGSKEIDVLFCTANDYLGVHPSPRSEAA